ncbi:integrase [Planococcus salinus]|uniref:integrase n=1 Tax=Planococcus salinus TaxID=1848460 RepID=UPI001F00CE9B|nr:integrase [Planococcus salinus]
MSYDFIKHRVGVDVQRVQQANKELPAPLPLELYVKILTLHELGHALDRPALQASLPRTIEIYEMKKKHPLEEQYTHPELLAMRIEEHKMNIAFEEAAWANAREMNERYHLADQQSFEQVKVHSLQTYEKKYQRDLQLYVKLTAAQKEFIA